MQRDAIVDFISQALEAVPFKGDPAEKPKAYHSDIGQLRIHTAGFVDPGTNLAVGGTAAGMSGSARPMSPSTRAARPRRTTWS